MDAQEQTVAEAGSPGDWMRAVVISAPGEYDLVTKPAPSFAPDELLLAPLAVGICRTDIELLDGTMVYLRSGWSHLPMTPGHEWVARIAAVGREVHRFSVGQRVVGECSVGCGHCGICLGGNYHQCPERRETGVMNLDGAMAGYFAFPARAAHPVPERMSNEDAVFAEPTAVALRAVLRAGIRPGERVLVIGGGTIGWLATALILDMHEVHLAFAELDASKGKRLEALGASPALPKETFDVVIEASGTPGGIARGLDALATSGRLINVGLSGSEAIGVDLDRIVVKDQAIIGSLGSPGVWPQALRLLGLGRVRPSSMITARHPLADFTAAAEAVRGGAAGVGKVLVIPGNDDRMHERHERSRTDAPSGCIDDGAGGRRLRQR